MIENYGHTVWSSLPKSEMFVMLVDSHKLKGSLPILEDKEVLLQLEALSHTVSRCIQKDCNYIHVEN